MTDTSQKWIHPWNLSIDSFDNLDRDTRFFSLLMRGLLNWLDTNVKLYDKNIRHFILQTGTEYLYQESNGYDFSWSESTGEDYIYMHKPRGVVEWEQVEIVTDEISSPYARGTYERYVNSDDELLGNYLEIQSFNAEIKILPLKLPIKIKYVLSRFNEQIILLEEILSMFAFTKYFSISHLGQQFECSIEFPTSITPAQTIKIDYNAERKDRIIEIQLDVRCQFPIVLEHTDVSTTNVIKNYVIDPQFIQVRPKPNNNWKPKWKHKDDFRFVDGSTGNINNPLFDEPSSNIPGPEISGVTSDGTSVVTDKDDTGGSSSIQPTTEYETTMNKDVVEPTLDERNKEIDKSLNNDPYDTKNNTTTAISEEFKDKIIKRLEEGLELRFSDHDTEVIERILVDIDQIYVNATKSSH